MSAADWLPCAHCPGDRRTELGDDPETDHYFYVCDCGAGISVHYDQFGQIPDGLEPEELPYALPWDHEYWQPLRDAWNRRAPAVWISWSGGECPVEPEQWVCVQMSGGEIYGNTASEYDWDYQGDDIDSDIIAYLPVAPPPGGTS